MATVTIDDAGLHIRLTTFERIFGLLRDLDVPFAQLKRAEAIADGLSATQGLRAPGLGIPGRIKIGTWRGTGPKQYVVARRGPALHAHLGAGAPYDELIVTDEAAAQLAAEVQARRPSG